MPTEMLASGARVTVIDIVPALPSAVALIVTDPGDTAVNVPSTATRATDWLLLVQTKTLPGR
jgi:putative heme iron utilization protein